MTEPQHAVPSSRREYWRDVIERMIRGFAQGMLAALGIGTATFDKGGLPWLDAFYIGLRSALIALLISLAGGRFGDPSNGSLRPAPQAPAPPQESAPPAHTPEEPPKQQPYRVHHVEEQAPEPGHAADTD